MISQTKAAQGKLLRICQLAFGTGLALGVFGLPMVSAANNPGEAIGTEFRINNTATNSQASPVTAMDADGDFVVAWEGFGEIGLGIFARCYNSSGQPVGSAFPVDASSTAKTPDIAMDADGDFLVIWEEDVASDDGTEFVDIYYRRYNERCEARDNQRVQVASLTSTNSGLPSVAMDADGDFVVAWKSNLPNSTEIFARRYNNLGVAQDIQEFQVSTSNTTLDALSMAMDADGGFIVVWAVASGTSNGIFARRFSADGTPQGDEFQTNAPNQTIFTPSVAMDADGDFIVAWERHTPGSNEVSEDIFARRYNNLGAAQDASAFQVNTSSGALGSLNIAIDADGDFAITWENLLPGENSPDIYAQRYSADGTPQGVEFRVNTTTANAQQSPSIALDADGDFVIAWESLLQDGDDFGIYAQRFAGPEDVDISIVVTDNLDPVNPGGLLNYSFIVTNNHTIVTPTGTPSIDSAIGTSAGINTVHTLPEGVSLDIFSGNNWSCEQTARTARQVDCAFSGKLLPTTATTAELTLSFDATAPAAADIVTLVTVTGDQFDADMTNNTDTEETQIRAPNTTPDAAILAKFVARLNVAPSTLITSNAITVTGIDAPAPISLLGVSGATYSIDEGPFTSSAGAIEAGSNVTVRQTSWPDFSTTTNAILVIGGITRTFSVSTAASLSDIPDEPDPIVAILNENSSNPATAPEPTTTPGSSGGGGCTLAGNRATAGGLGWLETLSLLFLVLLRRRRS